MKNFIFPLRFLCNTVQAAPFAGANPTAHEEQDLVAYLNQRYYYFK